VYIIALNVYHFVQNYIVVHKNVPLIFTFTLANVDRFW